MHLPCYISTGLCYALHWIWTFTVDVCSGARTPQPQCSGQHAGHVIWRPGFDSRWLHQWFKNCSSRMPWQGSVNQLLSCLKVGLLSNRRGFKSRSEQNCGLCWVYSFKFVETTNFFLVKQQIRKIEYEWKIYYFNWLTTLWRR